MNKIPFIHIGWPKAASSTLQWSLFHKHTGINPVGLTNDDGRVHDWLAQFYTKDTLSFDLDECRQGHKELFLPLMEKEEAAVVTCEQFVLPNRADRGLVAERLRDIFGEAKIIINLRQQIDELRSLYRYQHVRAIHNMSFEKFFERNWLNDATGFITFIEYEKVIKRYVELFGRENIKILFFEELLRDPAAYARDICEFIGVDQEEGAHLLTQGEHHNDTGSALRGRYTRMRMNYVLPGVELRKYVPPLVRDTFIDLLNSGQKEKVDISDELRLRIEDRVRDGNRRLAEEFNLPFADLGYPV
jgi:hypothetical protein